ncbi:MAG: hypothetical protein DRP08_06260 [Candidatus Aenigmatarchaeota archaeon]|nr:MAG: hypothetical protein DRP08_06260 [Candidatus Aenigmarchaeota archaeon]
MKARKKGYRGENEIVKLFKAQGFEAKRVPLSGANELLKGDVVIELKGKSMIGEVKRRKGGMCMAYEVLDQKDLYFFRADRKGWLVTLKLETLMELLS